MDRGPVRFFFFFFLKALKILNENSVLIEIWSVERFGLVARRRKQEKKSFLSFFLSFFLWSAEGPDCCSSFVRSRSSSPERERETEKSSKRSAAGRWMEEATTSNYFCRCCCSLAHFGTTTTTSGAQLCGGSLHALNWTHHSLRNCSFRSVSSPRAGPPIRCRKKSAFWVAYLC